MHKNNKTALFIHFMAFNFLILWFYPFYYHFL